MCQFWQRQNLDNKNHLILVLSKLEKRLETEIPKQRRIETLFTPDSCLVILIG